MYFVVVALALHNRETSFFLRGVATSFVDIARGCSNKTLLASFFIENATHGSMTFRAQQFAQRQF